jgi:hypothetical protein
MAVKRKKACQFAKLHDGKHNFSAMPSFVSLETDDDEADDEEARSVEE